MPRRVCGLAAGLLCHIMMTAVCFQSGQWIIVTVDLNLGEVEVEALCD